MPDYDEFIEYLDEIIDYDKIVGEYELSYGEIKAAIDKIKEFMGDMPLPDASQPAVQADARNKPCPVCGPEYVARYCFHCGRKIRTA